MRAPYIQGLATQDAPESCTGPREGVGEALTGAHVGQAIEPRNHDFRTPTRLSNAEGNTRLRATGEHSLGPAGSKNLCMRGYSMRENREIHESPCTYVRRAASGRPEATRR